jgi:alpha-mannosidase
VRQPAPGAQMCGWCESRQTLRTGFDGKGNTLPAEMLPSQIAFNDVHFQLAAAKTGVPNAVATRGQTIDLPAGNYNRVYLLAASTDGDQRVAFRADNTTAELNIEDWGGFIGQWDDRMWSSSDTSHGNYCEMTGLKPGFIKRADLAWYCSHHHDASGKNIAYAYSYLFGYAIDLPPGSKTLQLPQNDKIRILAISVAHESPNAHPAQPLYDELPSPNAGAPDFTIFGAPAASVSQGRSVSSRILMMPRGSFDADVHLTASGLPDGVIAAFSPAETTGASVLTLTAANLAPPATSAVTISAVSGTLSHSTSVVVSVTPVLSGTVPLNLSTAFNVTGIYKDGMKFSPADSLDGDGYALSVETLGTEQVGSEAVFTIGPPAPPTLSQVRQCNCQAEDSQASNFSPWLLVIFRIMFQRVGRVMIYNMQKVN